MALVLRNVKGSALTYSELDGNFTFITSSFVQNSLTSSMTAGSASYVIGQAYPGAGPTQQSFNVIAGSSATNLTNFVDVLLPQLATKTLGVNCFITATPTGSASSTIEVTSLTTGTVRFTTQNPSVGFCFHVMYY